MSRRLVPYAALARLDPPGAPNVRTSSPYEVRVVQDFPFMLWMLEEQTNQEIMWEYENLKLGRYNGVVRQNGSWTSDGQTQSVKFTTPTQYMVASHGADFDSPLQTYEVWVRPDAIGIILSRLGLFELSVDATDAYLIVNDHATLTAPVANLYDGSWHSFHIVFGSTNYFLYYDGLLVDFGIITTLPTPNTPLYFGRNSGGITEYRGGMGAPAFYQAELSDDVILDHYETGSRLSYAALVAEDTPFLWNRMLASEGHDLAPATITESAKGVVMTKIDNPLIDYARMNHITGDVDSLICRTVAGSYNAIASAANTPQNSMTFEYWVAAFTQHSRVSGVQRTFYVAFRSYNNPRAYFFSTSESGTPDPARALHFRIDTGANELHYQLNPANGLIFGRTYHVVMVHDESIPGSELNTIYVNGQQVAQNAGSSGLLPDASEVSIGGNAGDVRGRLVESEYAVYNYALPLARIQLHYDAVQRAKKAFPYWNHELAVMEDNPEAFYRWSAGRVIANVGLVDVSDNDRTIGADTTIDRTWVDCPYDALYGYAADYDPSIVNGATSAEFLSLYQFTLEFTIQPNSVPPGSTSTIIWKVTDEINTSSPTNITGGGIYIGIRPAGHANPGSFYFVIQHHAGSAEIPFTTAALAPGTQYHFAFTYDGDDGSMELFENGVSAGTATLSQTGNLKSSGLAAIFASMTTRRPDAYITDMIAYSSVLAPARIEAHARAAGLYVP